MKLNFWQWLGVALLVVGVIVYLFEKTGSTANPPGATAAEPVASPAPPAPTTAPAATE